MLKKSLLTLTVLGTMALSGASFAADAPVAKDGVKGAKMQDWKQKKFKEIDTNNDGKISKEEYLNFEGKKFDEIDANKKGAITPADFDAYHQKMHDKFKAEHPDFKGHHGHKDDAGTPPAGDEKGAE